MDSERLNQKASICLITRNASDSDPSEAQSQNNSIVMFHGFLVDQKRIVTTRHGLPQSDISAGKVQICFPSIPGFREEELRVDLSNDIVDIKLFLHEDGLNLCLITFKNGYFVTDALGYFHGGSPSFKRLWQTRDIPHKNLECIEKEWLKDMEGKEATALAINSDGDIIEIKGVVGHDRTFSTLLNPGQSGCPIIIEESMVLAGTVIQIRGCSTDFELVNVIMQQIWEEEIIGDQDQRLSHLSFLRESVEGSEQNCEDTLEQLRKVDIQDLPTFVKNNDLKEVNIGTVDDWGPLTLKIDSDYEGPRGPFYHVIGYIPDPFNAEVLIGKTDYDKGVFLDYYSWFIKVADDYTKLGNDLRLQWENVNLKCTEDE